MGRFVGGFYCGLHRADEDVRVAAFQAGNAFHAAEGGQVFREAHEELFAQVRMGDFAAPELDDGLHAIALLEEADGMIFLEAVVVVVGVGAELEFFDLNDVLFLLSVVLLFFLLVLIVTKVDGLGDGGHGGGRNQHEIETHFLGLAQRSGRGHDFGGPVGEDRADFASANQLIDVFSAIRPARRKISTGEHAN